VKPGTSLVDELIAERREAARLDSVSVPQRTGWRFLKNFAESLGFGLGLKICLCASQQ
jgi:hypothetical protein